MNRTLFSNLAMLAVLYGGIPGSAFGQDLTSQTLEIEPLRLQPIAVDAIDGLLENLVSGRARTTIDRTVLFGEITGNNTSQVVVARESAYFDSLSQALIVSGKFGGADVVEEFRVFGDDDNAFVAHDIYLTPQSDLFIGRERPVSLSSQPSRHSGGGRRAFTEATAAPAPTISSIAGVTSDSSGISNGLVNESCGKNWNSYRVVNDQHGMYLWTIYGNNFGMAAGAISMGGGISVTIQSWSNTKIVIDPIISYSAAPVSVVFTVRTAAGAVGNFGASIVPSVRSRIYSQCAWWVAVSRLNMGKIPSATAYGGYSSITAQWIPQAGDQLQWGGVHTAIISGVQPPVTQSGIKTWTVTITEYNNTCQNTFHQYTTTFAANASTNKVVSYPKSSVTSFGSAVLFYR